MLKTRLGCRVFDGVLFVLRVSIRSGPECGGRVGRRGCW